MVQVDKHIIPLNKNLKEALSILNALTIEEEAPTVLFIVSEEILQGTLTDGDIRRGLMKGATMDTPIKELMNSKYRFLTKGKFGFFELNELRKKQIFLIPVLDDKGRICDLYNLNHQKSILPIDAVIMAGGRGQRLYPLTKDIPKPMLKVGDKPILEINVDRLIEFGVQNIHISVNYLSDVIISYFEQKNKKCSLNFVKENEPLGTIGSITLVDEFHNDYVLLMNSDLLTDVNFEDLLVHLIENKADMIVVSIPYRVAIPYAVMETKGIEINKLVEKPIYTYHSNGGIYLFKKEFLKYIAKNTFFNATDLMQIMIDSNHKVIYYDLIGYWLDIGSPEDYEKAQSDILQLNL
ncbi:MAG: nucleotidyltransferase family protein [Bacteroidetes bacterium]|nr:nucleotidyltransferase family protein [Bacteroidota bacterium]